MGSAAKPPPANARAIPPYPIRTMLGLRIPMSASGASLAYLHRQLPPIAALRLFVLERRTGKGAGFDRGRRVDSPRILAAQILQRPVAFGRGRRGGRSCPPTTAQEAVIRACPGRRTRRGVGGRRPARRGRVRRRTDAIRSSRVPRTIWASEQRRSRAAHVPALGTAYFPSAHPLAIEHDQEVIEAFPQTASRKRTNQRCAV